MVYHRSYHASPQEGVKKIVTSDLIIVTDVSLKSHNTVMHGRAVWLIQQDEKSHSFTVLS